MSTLEGPSIIILWKYPHLCFNTEKSPSPEKKDPESPPITDSKQPPLPPSNGKAIDHGQKSKKFDTTSQAIPPPDLGENAQRQTTPNSYRCHINNMTEIVGIPTIMFTLEGRGHLLLNCGNTHTYVYIRGVIYSYIVEIPTLMFTLEGRGRLFLNCGNTHTYVYIRGAVYY
jgi:hypothetical protein